MRLYTSQHVFDHPWPHVLSGHWNKYPNPFSTSVLSTDILERGVGPNGNLRTTRLLSSAFSLPAWAKRIIGVDRVHAIEHSEIDPEARELRIRSRNVSYSNLITIEESIVYRQHPDDPNKTLMLQVAEVQVPSMSFAEKPLTDNIAKNASKGREAMDWAVNHLPSDFKLMGSPVPARRTMPS